MQSITVGKIEIPYSVRESQKASNFTIHVRPESVEIVVPEGTAEEIITTMVKKRSNWIFTKQVMLREMAHKQNDSMPVHFRSGAKILYRGRRVLLHIEKSHTDDLQIRYSNGFYISVPNSLNEASWDGTLNLAITNWMKQQVLKDTRAFVRRYSQKLDLYPKDIRVKEQKHFWGSMGKDKILNINWTLAYAPKQILEYVVIHELCHLKYRNHSPEFWNLIGSVFSDYERCREWLEIA